ncbi:MAG: TPD domain-containing protein [Archaeoglobaceae archaeon]|uniref:CDAN1-interacting nuclease 1 n=1 Tax=Archaeoglobus fulgidus TaxID=2234 RepID=A0A7J3M2M8_ARCFL
MIVSIQDYLLIRKNVNKISDLNKFGLPRGILHSILIQKKVESVKRKYHLFAERKEEILRHWKEEKSFPRWLTLTPVMKVRLLLKAMNFSAKEINRALTNPWDLDPELSGVVYKSVSSDFVYSPIATRIQQVLGQIGEKIVEEKLRSLGINFKVERELKMQKTPDFFFEEPIELFGRKIRWIESKALFADHKIYDLYARKQIIRYREMFGEGLVVFWRGVLQGIDASDGEEFDIDLRKKLLEMKIYLLKEEESDGNALKLAEEFVKSYAERNRFPYNAEVAKILRNMGFDVREED